MGMKIFSGTSAKVRLANGSMVGCSHYADALVSFGVT